MIEDGDIINLDVTVFVHGMHADLNETFFIGNVDADSRMLVRTAFDCLKNAIEMGALLCAVCCVLCAAGQGSSFARGAKWRSDRSLPWLCHATVRPGTMYRDLGTAISKTARKNKCSVVTTYCGHGVHELFHTAPNVPHYARNKAVGSMKPGHCFTIEPMINRGKECVLWLCLRWVGCTWYTAAEAAHSCACVLVCQDQATT